MQTHKLHPNSIITLNDFPVHNEQILKLYFRFFQHDCEEIVPPVPVMKVEIFKEFLQKRCNNIFQRFEAYLQCNSDAKYLKPVYLTLGFKSPSYDKEQIANGGILLYGEGTIDFKKNQCVKGYLNLVTGKGSTMRTWCWIE